MEGGGGANEFSGETMQPIRQKRNIVRLYCRLKGETCIYLPFLVRCVDRPDPPCLLTVEDITTNSLILSWRSPVWDGGSNITNYLVERREHPLTSWIRVGNTR